MDSQLYISSAILGVFLAIVCIYGWRRIVPVLFFGLILVKVAPAQSYDSDNDVPAINEVRDAIQYQMSVLQYELQLLSNQLSSSGQSIGQSGVNAQIRLDDIKSINSNISSVNSHYLPLIRDNTTNIVPWLSENNDELAAILDKAQDMDTELEAIKNNSNLTENTLADSLIELEDINNTNSSYFPQILNQVTGTANLNSAQLLQLQQLDQDNDVPAIQALQSLLAGYGQWDTDNDVEAIESVEDEVHHFRVQDSVHHDALMQSTTQILTTLTSISNAMNEISDPATSSPPADIVLTSPNTNIPTFETVAPDPLQVPILDDLAQVDQDESKLKPFTEIEQNIDDNIQHFDDTTQWDIPLFGQGNIVNLQHANMLGNIQETINGDMRQHFVTLAAIIKPILTAFLIWIVIRWTTKTTISTVSG